MIWIIVVAAILLLSLFAVSAAVVGSNKEKEARRE